ncbi:MAG: metal ABC transporter substrate-binding protein [Syntrophorhabdaceae bacterium]
MRRTYPQIIVPLMIALFLIVAFVSCGRRQEAADHEKTTVITTLFPLYDFTRQVAGEKANVVLLLPPGVEAHSFEPKPADIIRISRANVFIYTGKYMEPWAGQIVQSADNPKLVVLDTSRGIKLMAAREDHDAESGDERHDHRAYDPHVWLDFHNAIKMIDTIAEGICGADSGNCDIYRTNARNYKERLTGLDRRYREALSHCKRKTIVHGGHFAFGYLARSYGLHYVSAYGGSPNSEPTARKIIELKKRITENHVKYVYYEELLNPRISKIISNETGAILLKLNGAHNITKEEFARGVTFLSLMDENLANLKKGLECE